MVKCSYLLVILVADCTLLCSGIDCEGMCTNRQHYTFMSLHTCNVLYSSVECCYWYRKFPATPSLCNTTRTSTVTLKCEVQHWLNNNSNLEVKWYKSSSEESAGKNGEILTDKTKYNQHNNIRTVLNEPLNLIKQYFIGIMHFESSDIGYYWCQMVINNISLPPSPYGHITNTSTQCSLFEVTCTSYQPLCAQNLSINTSFMAYLSLTNETNDCSLLEQGSDRTATVEIANQTMSTNFPDISTATVAITTMISTTFNIDSSATCAENYSCSAGIAVGIVLMILTITVLSALVYVYYKKHKSQGKYDDTVPS